MNLQETAQVLLPGVAIHNDVGKQDTTALAQAYHMVIGHLPFKLALAAMLYVLANCKFFPKPSEILEAAAALLMRDYPSADAAWMEVQRQVRDTGRYKIPTWSNPLIGEALNGLYGGWVPFCDARPQPADQVRFTRIYEGLLHERRRRVLTPKLLDEYLLNSGPDAQSLLDDGADETEGTGK